MSRFHKSLSFITACFLMLADGIYGQSLGLHHGASSEKASMTVHVYNYAGLSRSDLKLAESVAAEIFLERGVQIVWYDCRASSRADDDPRCSQSVGLTTFKLRICRSCTSFLAVQGREVGGYATGQMATVSSLWVAQLETTLYVPSAKVLGRVIAHELGHLVLGPAHSPVGIMKANWTAKDFDHVNIGMLMFTSEQGELIRSSLKFRGSANDETVVSAKSNPQLDLASANK